MQTQFVYLPIDFLQSGHYQPRQDFSMVALEELAQSISTQGLIEPLVVRLIAQERYEIIAGERRWRAAKLAGLKEIPCLVGEYTDKQACALSLIENIQRQDLNLIEESNGYRRLIDEFHYLQEEIAVLVGKSRSHIANILRLQTLSEPIKGLIKEKILSLGHARALIGLTNDQQSGFANQIVKEQWSVRQLEHAIKTFKNSNNAHQENAKKDKDIERLQIQLSDQVGAPVQIINDPCEGGWLKLKFFDNDTLAGLLERLGLRYD